MFTTQHYKVLASVLHEAHENGTDDEWATIYNLVYIPLTAKLMADNDRFNATKFSWAVASGEGLV